MEQMNLPDSRFYKNEESDTIFWVDTTGVVGQFLFTFDKKNDFQYVCRLSAHVNRTTT